MPTTEQLDKFDAAMESLWHLGIIAMHGTGSARGEGVRACRDAYAKVGQQESGFLGFCYYRQADAEASAKSRNLELVCGDFLNKNLVTRGVQKLVCASMRTAGIEATIERGVTPKVVLRSFCAHRDTPHPTPPLHVSPEPPADLVATTTAIPARSAPQRSSRAAVEMSRPNPLDKARDVALGLAAPVRVPDVVGTEAPSANASGSQARRKAKAPPAKLTPSARRAVGVSLTLAGAALIIILRETNQLWVGGIVFVVLGLTLFILGLEKKPQR